MKRNFFRLISAFIAVLIALFSVTSCSDSLASTKEEKRTVMTIGGFEVPYELYRYIVMNYKAAHSDQDDTWNDEQKANLLEEEIKSYVNSSLRDIYSVFSLCAEHGIKIDDDLVKSAVDASVNQKKGEYKSNGEYKKALADNYMNDSVFRLIEANNTCKDQLYYKLIENGDIKTDDSFLNNYIYGDGFIRIKQILVVGESSSNLYGDTYFTAAEKHTDSEAKAIAEEAAAKAAAGDDFDTLVAEYGESLFMFNNNDGYYICPGMWDKENEAAVFSLEVGQVSGVVESEKGFSVFKREEKDTAYLKNNYNTLCEEYKKAAFTVLLEKRSAELEIKTNELYDSCSIKEMK